MNYFPPGIYCLPAFFKALFLFPILKNCRALLPQPERPGEGQGQGREFDKKKSGAKEKDCEHRGRSVVEWAWGKKMVRGRTEVRTAG